MVENLNFDDRVDKIIKPWVQKNFPWYYYEEGIDFDDFDVLEILLEEKLNKCLPILL